MRRRLSRPRLQGPSRSTPSSRVLTSARSPHTARRPPGLLAGALLGLAGGLAVALVSCRTRTYSESRNDGGVKGIVARGTPTPAASPSPAVGTPAGTGATGGTVVNGRIVLNGTADVTQTASRTPLTDYNIVNPGLMHDAAVRDTLSGSDLTDRNTLLSAYFAKRDLTFISCAEPEDEPDASKCTTIRVKQKLYESEWLCAKGACTFDGVSLSEKEIGIMAANERQAPGVEPPFIKTTLGYYECRAAFVGPPVCTFHGATLP